ncbi:Paraneoplastic antigen Ma2 [Mizuhopecten yessoensis]|uniref:Paraneoplastic antigen Ma2 n=1 Tax=Mizuhopecten yessoensis TaxID=6573 RepID=A0A210QYK7_MIZYE|nr:Paraneoplastic antigen Ma2 [Mizuhopecten yessoensis]
MSFDKSFSDKDVEVITATLLAMGYKPQEGQLSSEELRSWIRSKETIKDPKQEDGACALSTPTVTVSPPVRMSIFSGEEKDTSYDLWKHEVESLLLSHGEDVVTHALRRSLKGKAGIVVMHLGLRVSVRDILTKMDSIFGTVEKGEALLAQFYSARQKEGEDAASWSCRLEDILNKAVKGREVTYAYTGDMLRTMFWTGLRRDLKDITGHKYDAIQDFDQLVIAVRQVEQDLKKREEETQTKKPRTEDLKTTTKPNPACMASAEATDDIKEMKGMIKQLTADMTKMKKTTNQYQKFNSKSGDSKSWTNQQGQQPQQRHQFNSHQSELAQPHEDGPLCWRCGQRGHIKLGCRVRIDHLNGEKPTKKGSS